MEASHRDSQSFRNRVPKGFIERWWLRRHKRTLEEYIRRIRMKAVSMKEARNRFADLVEAAARGAEGVITRRGKKIAKLTGIARGTIAAGLPPMAEFRASLKSAKPGKATIGDLRAAERA